MLNTKTNVNRRPWRPLLSGTMSPWTSSGPLVLSVIRILGEDTYLTNVPYYMYSTFVKQYIFSMSVVLESFLIDKVCFANLDIFLFLPVLHAAKSM